MGEGLLQQSWRLKTVANFVLELFQPVGAGVSGGHMLSRESLARASDFYQT